MALSNSQYDELIRRYNVRQLENQHELEERTAAIYAKDARLAEIDAEIAGASVAQAKKLIDGDADALSDLRRQLARLKDEKNMILQRLGYKPEDLQLHYNCPDCRDTGYIDGRRCHCFVQAAIDLIYTQSNLKEILQEENFSAFSYEYYSDSMIDERTGLSSLSSARHAVMTCQKFIADFDTAFENLCFYGEAGVGKTFLSNCVAKELLDSGHSVVYFTAFQLFDIFEKNTFDRDSDVILAHQNIFDCDLLIIDDLGTELANSFTTSKLFLCLNERMLHRKSTLISTNLSMEDLTAVYSERICSRIFSNYTMIRLFGDDIRLKKKLKRLQ